MATLGLGRIELEASFRRETVEIVTQSVQDYTSRTGPRARSEIQINARPLLVLSAQLKNIDSISR